MKPIYLTPFRQRVYDEARKIPRGTVITYGELARRIGCGSPRAVGQALRVNPFAPEVPCHRVVAADGSLTGFYGEPPASSSGSDAIAAAPRDFWYNTRYENRDFDL